MLLVNHMVHGDLSSNSRLIRDYGIKLCLQFDMPQICGSALWVDTDLRGCNIVKEDLSILSTEDINQRMKLPLASRILKYISRYGLSYDFKFCNDRLCAYHHALGHSSCDICTNIRIKNYKTLKDGVAFISDKEYVDNICATVKSVSAVDKNIWVTDEDYYKIGLEIAVTDYYTLGNPEKINNVSYYLGSWGQVHIPYYFINVE